MDAALVTGCSKGGLGEGIVRAFVKEGIHVFATARSLSSLTYLRDLPNTTLLALDVTSPESIASALEVVKSHTQTSTSNPNPNFDTSTETETNSNTSKPKPNSTLRVKYLLNNAGRGLVKPVLDGSGIADSERAVFETNVWGPLALIRAFAPLMISGESGGEGKGKGKGKGSRGGGGGMVVNITSGGAIVPLVWNGVYAASKAAMLMLSETMRLELEPLGVRTTTVVVGIVRTNFHANLRTVTSEVGGEADVDVPRFQLAEGSLYMGMKDVLREEASGKVQDERVMSAEEAGRRIVRDAVRGRRGKTYVGTKAGVLSVVGILPGWLVDSICRKTGQLGEFAKAG